MIPYAFGDILHHVQLFIEKYPKGLLCIRGTTATGKTSLAIELAKVLPLHCISADSRQIFRGMDIGTDKVPEDMRKNIPHHQIDIVNPDQQYTAGQWAQDVKSLIPQIHAVDAIPLIVGGTGLYIDTIYKNFTLPEVEPNEELRKQLYAKEEETPGILHTILAEVDPASAHSIHPHSTRYIVRALEIYYATGTPKSQIAIAHGPEYPMLMIGLRRNLADNEQRIHQRVIAMLENGLIDETKKLIEKGYTLDLQAMQGIGYRECALYLEKQMTYDEVIQSMSMRTRTYAKRQRTWLRRYIDDAKNPPFPSVQYRIYQM